MIAIFTGTRLKTEKGGRVVFAALETLTEIFRDDLRVYVGDCRTGIDAHVRRQCRLRGIEPNVFKANWQAYGLKAGPLRNRDMILSAKTRSNGDVLLFYFTQDPGTKGTRDCVRRAEAAGIECRRLGGSVTLP